MPNLTRANARHLVSLARLGRNPAATVYDSLGGDFFLSPAPGWLNLGLWEGRGDASEAPDAVVRLASVLAAELPAGRDIVDVANGLGAQDLVIRSVARPRNLIALNVTETQLRSGRARLEEASATPLVADATALPLADDSADGIISIEAAFHFPSRHGFFAEARRVLRPGGVLTMSDVSAERTRTLSPREAVAGLTNLRVWGIRRRSLMTSVQIEHALIAAGFVGVRVRDVSHRVFPPAIRFFSQRLRTVRDGPLAYRWGSGLLLRQWELLAARDVMRYLLVRAEVPG
ncbi:MAG: class I SAM-dependent methyltransferase [Actinomycetota bacterium]